MRVWTLPASCWWVQRRRIRGGMAAQYFAAQREAIEEHDRRFVGRRCRLGGSRPIPGTRAEGVLPHPRRAGPGQIGRRVSLDQVPGLATPLDQPDGWPIGCTLGPPFTYSPTRDPGWERTGPVPDSVPELAKVLEDLLARAAAKSGRTGCRSSTHWTNSPRKRVRNPPFLVTEGLPPNVYVVVTARPGRSPRSPAGSPPLHAP